MPPPPGGGERCQPEGSSPSEGPSDSFSIEINAFFTPRATGWLTGDENPSILKINPLAIPVGDGR